MPGEAPKYRPGGSAAPSPSPPATALKMLWLLGCLCLAAGPALAKVGSFGECRRFFYGGLEPKGLGSASAAAICQQRGGQPRFATLYDRERSVPRWSAYVLRAQSCPGQAQRRSQWFVEPQLASASMSPDMATESESGLCCGAERPGQALSEHYEDTAFSRGQLNPGDHHCDAARTATFTLTNAVPLEPCFAHGRWRLLQRALRDQLRLSCPAGAYVVTGATPGTVAIPSAADKEGDRERQLGRVVVPRHVWTAVCCDSTKPEEKFSLAFLAENTAASRVQAFPVKTLAERLAAIHATSESVEIFADDCNSQSPKVQAVIAGVQNALDFSMSPAAGWKEAEDAGNAEEEEGLELDAATTLSFSSLRAWHQRFTKLHRQGAVACVLQRADAAPGPEPPAGSWAKECVLQQQKHLPSSLTAAEGWSCDRLPCDTHGEASYRWCYAAERRGESRVPCCSSRCAVPDGERQLSCDRGDGERISCSPLYSAVTVKGQSCRDGFPCGLYGKSYFWCYTDEQGSWDYCCAPQHFCGGHGYGYSWCYVDNRQSSWKKCAP
ncbi:uncharacterized protein LOC134152869 [Rhea pennata]|uniref:uncharacterized protein LOC134152869 n=1 Tax=Rhea pennata TaxID=8795 RepID=UPI002E253B37